LKLEGRQRFRPKRKIFFFLYFFFICLFLMADDIRIDSYRGNLKKVNALGGFIIGKVEGSCDLTSRGGPISIDTVTKDLTAVTSAGRIEINDIQADARIVTGGGNIHVQKARGRLYAETYLGEIIIDSARKVEAKTITGGDIKIQDLQEYADITTTGNILVVMKTDPKKTVLCDLKSLEGDVTLYLPKDFAASLELRIPLGQNPAKENRIKSDFNFGELKQRREEIEKVLCISTTFNGGGGKIKILINKGNLFIKAFDVNAESEAPKGGA
jgi:DUF4097 and DUF4098 domain-containing protein YvlB